MALEPTALALCAPDRRPRGCHHALWLLVALVAEADWPAGALRTAQIERVWDPEFGDMRQELVLIGVKLPRASGVRA